jgi:hypothetical protein
MEEENKNDESKENNESKISKEIENEKIEDSPVIKNKLL